MPIEHKVKQGECITSIAGKYGFAPKTIWDHPNNADLKAKRADPNVLYPGDVLMIPMNRLKEEAAIAERRHRFRAFAKVRELRIQVMDEDGLAICNTPYRLTVGLNVYEGATDSEGHLSENIALDSYQATLTVGDYYCEVRIGDLNPVHATSDDGTSGVQGRLHNLGYDPGPIDGKIGPRTMAAIRAFQQEHSPLELSGECDLKTVARIVEEHGC